ncbi:MAG: M20/M25/M40 family metallo-hydrolase [Deltaproteobacteria bacterium]
MKHLCVLLLVAVLSVVLVPSVPAEPTNGQPRSSAGLAEAELDAVAARAPELLSRYLATDTTNPPGNEIVGARFLAAVLESEGIEARIYESAPGRGNLYARLKGNGEKRPLILLSHIDVVPAVAADWSHPPFAGEESDGIIYGRGALDAKGVGVVQLLAMVAAKRMAIPLRRDIILLATADEETGGRLGAGWMVDNHFELFDGAEFVLNEGGFIHNSPDKPPVYFLDAAEKGPCWFSVVASGQPGHGSRPARETAVTRLVEALGKLASWQRPLEVGPVVAGYYAAYAVLDEEHARQFRQLERSLEDDEFKAWFLDHPRWAALIQDTLVPTVLRGSVKTNIIAPQASAEVDSRLLPGHSCDDFLAAVSVRIGSEYVRVEPGDVSFPSSGSPLNNELTAAVESLAAAAGDAVVLPGLITGFTDSHYFREKGIAAYGFVPIAVNSEELDSIHAPDERVSAAELTAAVKRMLRLIENLAG